MRNICLLVSYDGTAYHGWQCQPNALTVEQVLRGSVERILNHPVKVYAGGRTDAGVHAQGQVVNFFTEKTIDLVGLARGLNSMLPADIRVRHAREVEMSFHARYSARSKTYVYCILNSSIDSPFHCRYAWHIPYSLDVPSMNGASKLLLGSHDFSAFKKKETACKNPVRKVLRVGVRRRGDMIHLVVEATGFLRYMMRSLVGTIALVGTGKLTEAGFKDILESGDRVKAGPTAPAHGLFLREIRYT
jgi:tRNA pseudouridine38-40 synthase